MTRVHALLRRLGIQRGTSLLEMLAVLTILSTVVTSLTAAFVSGTRSEVDLQRRVEAQNNATVALQRLRRDVHCATSATASTAQSVTLSVPCVSGGVVTWCAVTVSTGRYSFHRRPSSGTCGSTNALFADYLTTNSIFAYQAPITDTLAKLKTTLAVKLPTMVSAYRLCDILVMRNSVRGTTAGSAVSPC